MARPKPIYSLKGIFLNLLTDTGKTSFLIPTYQRGYKWTSLEGKGQVDILLKDLYNAFTSNSDRYYLQFLTLKSREHELEVIDGQQRLTTLTILLCVIEYLHESDNIDNYVYGKLKYQTRQNFIEKYIYNNVDQLLNSKDWNSFRDQNPEHDNQDVYFIYNAAWAIHDFITNTLSQKIDQFYKYISYNVNLIVNLLEEDLNSEKVFVNVNKGVKLNDEDLVKGLLITKLPLDHLSKNYRTTEVEINEWRTNLGRQWDDLSNWASQRSTLSFFRALPDDNRLEWLIRLTYQEIEHDESEHPMFDHLDHLYVHQRITAGEIFDNIRETKMMLNDWYSQPEMTNLLGYLLHANNSPKKERLWEELKKGKTKQAVVSSLKNMTRQLLPLNDKGEFNKDLNYEEHYKDIFNVFLILDIAKFLPLNGNSSMRYDFSRISSGDWSLEHIFPQNAKDLKSIDKLSKNDLQIIQELIHTERDNLKTEQTLTINPVLDLYDKIQNAKDECLIDDDEREPLAKLLSDNAPDLHRIGNLALLQKNINSGLSNHFFNEKRKILVKKISEGKFVPFHTYDVFSKLVLSNDSGLHTWSKQDILDHERYIHNQIDSIIEYLNKQ
jgi:hypothetical protein